MNKESVPPSEWKRFPDPGNVKCWSLQMHQGATNSGGRTVGRIFSAWADIWQCGRHPYYPGRRDVAPAKTTRNEPLCLPTSNMWVSECGVPNSKTGTGMRTASNLRASKSEYLFLTSRRLAPFEQSVESDYVYPLLRGKDVGRWYGTTLQYIRKPDRDFISDEPVGPHRPHG